MDESKTEAVVRQHEYAPGGTFELRVGEAFPPHIVYVDRDTEGRRRVTFVAEVYANAIAHAQALVEARKAALDEAQRIIIMDLQVAGPMIDGNEFLHLFTAALQSSRPLAE